MNHSVRSVALSIAFHQLHVQCVKARRGRHSNDFNWPP